MDLLKLGQKINIIFQKGERIVEIGCTLSGIDDDRLKIELPQYFMRYIEYLDVGCSLTVKVFSKLGTIDFNTIVISSPLEDDFIVEYDPNALKLTTNSEIQFINSVENLEITKGEEIYKVRTFEISTSYLKFNSDKEFAINDIVYCKLYLSNNYGIISFKGIINYIDPVYDTEYKLAYSTMTEEDRRALLYYMYLYTNSSD